MQTPFHPHPSYPPLPLFGVVSLISLQLNFFSCRRLRRCRLLFNLCFVREQKKVEGCLIPFWGTHTQGALSSPSTIPFNALPLTCPSQPKRRKSIWHSQVASQNTGRRRWWRNHRRTKQDTYTEKVLMIPLKFIMRRQPLSALLPSFA